MYGGGGWGGWYPWYWFMSSSMICTIRILETTLQGIGNKMALHPPPRPPPLPPPPLDVTTVRGTSAPQSPDLPIPRLESARRRSVSASPPLLPAPSLVASVIGPGLPFVGSIVPCCAHRHRLVGVAPRSLLGHFWAVNRQIRPPRHRGSPDPSSSPLVSVGAWPLKGGGASPPYSSVVEKGSLSPPPCVVPPGRLELLADPPWPASVAAAGVAPTKQVVAPAQGATGSPTPLCASLTAQAALTPMSIEEAAPWSPSSPVRLFRAALDDGAV
jgi:hypothetical protein